MFLQKLKVRHQVHISYAKIRFLDSIDQAKVISDESVKLTASLEDMKSKDDLSPKLAKTELDAHEELFKTELMKYDELIEAIDQNVNKQMTLRGDIDKALDDVQQAFDNAAWREKANQYCKDVEADVSEHMGHPSTEPHSPECHICRSLHSLTFKRLSLDDCSSTNR